MESSAPPKVSVIIPLYNKAPYIKRALDSVLSQTVQDFEVIVVNDGSKDGGDKIVEEYGDSRIRLINQENQGVSAARNHGVDAAKAELVAFLDADDEWLPEFLKTVLHMWEKWPDAGMYGTGFKTISPTGIETNYSYHTLDGERILDSYFAAKMDFCNHRGGQLITTSGTVVNRDIFQKVRGFPEWAKQSEDRALRGKVALISNVAYSPKICTIYYSDTENNSSHISEFLKDPFYEWMKKLPPKTYAIIQSRNDYGAIVDFNEAAQLYMVWRNLHDSPKSRWEIFEQIKEIQLPHNKILKYKYIFYWILPASIRKYFFIMIEWMWKKMQYYYNHNKNKKIENF